MAYFLVLLHGIGIEIPGNDADKPIVGFYATRIVSASSPDEAESKAKSMVDHDWTTGEYAKSNVGAVPTLALERIRRPGILQRLTFKNTGYVFYPAE